MKVENFFRRGVPRINAMWNNTIWRKSVIVEHVNNVYYDDLLSLLDWTHAVNGHYHDSDGQRTI